MAEAFREETANPVDAKADAVAWLFEFGAESGLAWLAVDGSTTLGYVLAQRLGGPKEDWDAEIRELYVVPGGHRRSASLAALNEVCRELRSLGAGCVFIALDPADDAARAYYWRHGFETSVSGMAVRYLRD